MTRGNYMELKSVPTNAVWAHSRARPGSPCPWPLVLGPLVCGPLSMAPRPGLLSRSDGSTEQLRPSRHSAQAGAVYFRPWTGSARWSEAMSRPPDVPLQLLAARLRGARTPRGRGGSSSGRAASLRSCPTATRSCCIVQGSRVTGTQRRRQCGGAGQLEKR